MSPRQRMSVQAQVADDCWAAALRLREFRTADLAADVGIGAQTARKVIHNWLAEGAVHSLGDGRSDQTVYRADADFVRLPGPRSAEQNLWDSMRKKGGQAFTPTDLSCHATTDHLKVSPAEAAAYCQALLKVGYLRVRRRAAPAMGREALYQLANLTGPKAPVIRRVRAIWDQNTDALLVLEDRK